jgi:molecular chaperone GrpE
MDMNAAKHDQQPDSEHVDQAEDQLEEVTTHDLSEDVESIEEPIVESELDILRAENAELKERLLRQQADFDNVRKRLRREMEETGTRAVVRFVRPLLTELDNFERAILAANPDAFQDFAMGVSMIKENVDGILSSQGIEPVPAEGVFDPAVPEVIAEVEHPDQPRGQIVEVFRSGYRLGGQIIRAAQVVVARPPKDVEPQAAEGEAES